MKTAPHKKWLEELTLELRLNDVPGQEIGDALATVEEFVADSGQSPEEAFGTPRDYAAILAAETPRPAKESLRGVVALTAASLVVFLAFSAALTPWSRGGQLLVGGVQLACFAALAALTLTLPLYLAYVVRHCWALIALPIVGAGAGVLSAVLQPRNAAGALLVLSPGVALLVSAGLLIALSVLGTTLTLHTPADTVVDPLNPELKPRRRWFEVLTQWLFPLLAVFLAGLTAVVSVVAP
ncbi:hypothetical protein ACX80E_00205 [Arthrobacter sp. TMN-49]